MDESVREETRSDGESPFNVSTAKCCPNVDVVYSWSGKRTELPQDAAMPLQNSALRYEEDTRSERVNDIRVLQFGSTIARFRYELAGREGAVDVQEWTGAIAADDTALVPFRALRRRLQFTSTSTLVASLGLVWLFASRHWYFAESPAVVLLTVLALLWPPATVVPVTYAARPMARRSSGILVAAVLPAIRMLGGTATNTH